MPNLWDLLILDPMTNLLLLLYQVLFSNFALAVVVFTLITRLITLPFTLKQQRSSKAMQELQPELQGLQKKYATDKEKLAQEQMALYKKHGINPMGGCLPLLLTMPIMFGLYRAIMASLAATPLQLLELSQRLYKFLPNLAQLIPLNNKWLGINLAQPPGATQPWYAYLLILLVVATGYWQQKVMTPQTASSGQADNQMAGMSQSMMYTMPIMFGFFALSFASGLSIYFVISNLIGVLQYWGLGRMGMLGASAAAPAAPAAKATDPKASDAPPKPKPAGKSKKKRAKR